MTTWILSYVSSNHYTAGSPTETEVLWTSLKAKDIATYIKDTYHIHVYNNCVKRILKEAGYVKRKPIKDLAIGNSKHRKKQFEILIFLVGLFHEMDNNPLLSMDTKKKEKFGNFTRNETIVTKKGQEWRVLSSDYANLATGKLVPHGIYDVKLNSGYLSLGNSNETADFVVDNLKYWWLEFGQFLYPDAKRMMILCDCGGANGYRHHRFKVLLQKLAKEIGIKIMIVHYPPYCSKYNPIERKLFSHVHRTIRNSILIDLEQSQQLMAKTSTKQGLRVHVRIVDKFYPKKQRSKKEDINERKILRHPELPQFSYTLIP